MDAKEKAKELIEKYIGIPNCEQTLYHETCEGFICSHIAKQCALIAVDEIINYQQIVLEHFPSDGHHPSYWQSVKEEIEKL